VLKKVVVVPYIGQSVLLGYIMYNTSYHCLNIVAGTNKLSLAFWSIRMIQV
jgi:hypothetical protein